MKNLIEKILITPRGNIHYWISEKFDVSRNTLFFFPGLTADHTMFSQQAVYFRDAYNIIVWDAPAHGKSRPYRDFSLENASQDILEILNRNGIGPIVCIGQSYGGYFAQAFMMRYPDRVTGLVGIGTSPYGQGYYSKSDIFWLRQTGWMAMACPFSMLQKAAARQATVTEYGYENMLSMISAYGKKEYAHLMQTAYNAFLRDNRDFEVTCPVLILYGEDDKAGKVRQYCNEWADAAGYPLVVIRNAGHNANVDNPGETNQLIGRFVEDDCI